MWELIVLWELIALWEMIVLWERACPRTFLALS